MPLSAEIGGREGFLVVQPWSETCEDARASQNVYAAFNEVRLPTHRRDEEGPYPKFAPIMIPHSVMVTC